MTMLLVVEQCNGCPFFRKSLVSLIASGPNAGDCCAPALTKYHEITQARSLPVEDSRTLPHWCPLRLGSVTVSIGNRGTA